MTGCRFKSTQIAEMIEYYPPFEKWFAESRWHIEGYPWLTEGSRRIALEAYEEGMKEGVRHKNQGIEYRCRKIETTPEKWREHEKREIEVHWYVRPFRGLRKPKA